jgi:mersacidin/lichenicidin family type 2 lantibiotic
LRTKDKEFEMTNENIVRAWRDPQYRNSLSETERATLPAHPAGSIELEDAELNSVAGGRPELTRIIVLCTPFNFC